MANRPLLYLIDGHAVAYRQFHALPEAGFSTQSGEITNAVYGFTRILIDILLDKKPKYLAVTFDAGLSGRDELFTDYKATREKMPDSLRDQLNRIHQVVEAFNIPILSIEGYEADDVIGTIVKQAEQQNIDVLIVTGDRDILQLLSDHVKVQLPGYRSSPDQIFDIPAFIAKYQIEPDQLVDLKALMGDSSDNIPGVKGIGEKTGTALLLEYETLDGVYQHLDEITGSKGKKLAEGKEMAYISRELAQIQCDLPITLSLQDCVTQDFDFNAVAPLFRELEFRSLFDRLEGYNVTQLPLFNMLSEDEGFDAPQQLVDTTIVQDETALALLVTALNSATEIVWDVETTSIDQMQADLVGIALAIDGERAWYVPVGHSNSQSPQLPLQTVVDALRPALTNPQIAKYAHNAVYDLVVMQRYGIDVSPIAFDSMIAEWIREPISKFLGLKNFIRQYLGIYMTDIDALIGQGKNQKTMAQVSIESAAAYAAADAAMTMRAVHHLKDEFTQEEARPEGKLSSLEILALIDLPLIPIIAAMQGQGVVLDVPYLKEMSQRLDTQIVALEKEIYTIGDVGEFNTNSPKQLSEVLFDEDKLNLSKEGIRKTTQGYSTDAATLELLQGQHPIIEKIIEYRELTKLKSTYVDALPELVNPATGRIHTSYNQTGTSTGRFSSSNPNLQNIPIRTELGREVRRAFIAPAGYRLLAVDYSQIELRVMAHISGDQTLIAAFEAGQDIHRATAAAVFDVPQAAVTYEQRSFAKRVNFGLMYGMGEYRLARESNLTLAEARAFIARYFQRIPGVERYIETTKQFAIDQGYVETLLGRRRYFRHLQGERVNGQRAQGELRAAINMPIQGTAADILKLAMIQLSEALANSNLHSTLILQVHDELVLEVPENQVKEAAHLVVNTMQNAYTLNVPLVANAQMGQNWRDMQPLDT